MFLAYELETRLLFRFMEVDSIKIEPRVDRWHQRRVQSLSLTAATELATGAVGNWKMAMPWG